MSSQDKVRWCAGNIASVDFQKKKTSSWKARWGVHVRTVEKALRFVLQKKSVDTSCDETDLHFCIQHYKDHLRTAYSNVYADGFNQRPGQKWVPTML